MKKITIILLAALTFTMATGFADCKKNEPKELDMVEIPDMSIKMLKTEVTQKLYKSVMGENPSHFNGENNPVENVGWYDAIYFCNKLSEKEGLTPVYSVDGNTNPDSWGYTPHKGYKFLGDVAQNKNANGFRLPTEAEWEYAAKGGQNYTYSGSNNLNEVGWYDDNSGNKTHPVAQKKANGYGLYDMSGNVGEWCWDVFPLNSDGRYCRGGSYRDSGDYCGVSLRCILRADYQYDHLGFRIVCSAATGIADCKKNEPKELDMVEIPGKSIKMLKTEVTQKLYKSVMGENPSHFNGENNPVERVSWYDAIYFCNKLSEKLGFTPVYSVNGSTKTESWEYTPHKAVWFLVGDVAQNKNANGFRLPTEEEWEYAAKGGQDYEYSGSNKLNEVGWYNDNSGGKTHPVAQKKANGYGLYDMSGNVCEWCWDVSPDYSDYRYYRGGSYSCGDSNCEVSRRDGFIAYYQFDDQGFRIVCSASN